MFELLLLCFLGYKNSERAKLKGQNGLLWGVLTGVSFFIAMTIGMMVVVMFLCRDSVDMSLLSNPQANRDAVSQQFAQQVMQALATNPLRQFTILMFGWGGYLFVRYLIERKPDKKKPEIHWMDKMGGE